MNGEPSSPAGLPSGLEALRAGSGVGFYSNDHRPVHVHVTKAGAEAIFDMEEGVELRESFGFKVNDLARAQELAEVNRQTILDKWHEYFG